MGKVCTRCVMDDSDPGVHFDTEGRCDVCARYLEQKELRGYRPVRSDETLKQLVAAMKKAGEGREFDCVLGLSGGVDSSYMAYVAHEHGLRVLAVHVDTGWNSEMAVRNIERVCNGLGYELHTIVMDWPTMKELQRAYMFSGLANLDVPQDHLFCAAVYRFAKEYGVKYLLNGSNLATEGASAPFSAQHSYRDFWEMKSVYRRHGRGKSLQKYIHLNLREAWFGVPGVTKVNLLDYVPYTKTDAIAFLTERFGWEYYGGKHFESRFTKWFQSVYLPRRFGYDKRRYHLTCLVMNGEMTREQALEELARPAYPENEMLEDEAYILKKLDISPEQWADEMRKPPAAEGTYFSQAGLFRLAKKTLGAAGLDRVKSSRVHPMEPSKNE
ncbi:MAG TPA: N-acetyl sugar amidotransferase [Candidatus Limiplasma sp.]|nr:N-acetyl sugar amidotransferase [Candidatus Limiplasma sp.]HPS81603.1 N-acetyl sugar amidotransferase [Candidatus Limiplasma sp.]